MTKHFLASAAAIILCASASAEITVNYPSPTPTGELIVERASIASVASARRQSDLKIVSDTIKTEGRTSSSFATPDDTDYRFELSFGKDNQADFYTRPGESLTVNVTQFNPIRFTVTGTPLMDGMSQIMTEAIPIEEEAIEIQKGLKPKENFPALLERFVAVYTNFIEKNPESPAAVFAMLSLEPENFQKYESMVAPTAALSALYPLYEQKRAQVNAQMEAERRRQAMSSGNVDAPAFTLPDLDGKEVSLSDFKGKWVILDFWGSWCGWCIKGFPALKEAYTKYQPELEVIGIDCQEPVENWKAGVKKHQLPWVHLYLAQDRQTELLQAYGVQGFPTKVIINPEGKIVNITSGEDPAFYGQLAKFMGK